MENTEVREAVRSYYFAEGDVSFQSDDEWYYALGWTIQHMSRRAHSKTIRVNGVLSAVTLESAKNRYRALFTLASNNMHLDERANKLIGAVCMYEPKKWIYGHSLLLSGATDLHLTKR